MSLRSGIIVVDQTLLDLALSISHGEPWLSFKTTKGRVLYVNFEIQPWAFRDRIKSVASAKMITLARDALDTWNLRGRAADYATLLPKIRERILQRDYAIVILDPVYKLLGTADENKATDISRLMNAIEDLAVQTGAAVAFGAHFSKGNQSGKESIDRISGSGVFARDPDSILVMTRHEEDDAFAIETTLRNFKPIEPFVVRWQFPVMRRDESLDPTKLKQVKAGRPSAYSAELLLGTLQNRRLTSTEWLKRATSETGIGRTKFFELLRELADSGQIAKATKDEKWSTQKAKSPESPESIFRTAEPV